MLTVPPLNHIRFYYHVYAGLVIKRLLNADSIVNHKESHELLHCTTKLHSLIVCVRIFLSLCLLFDANDKQTKVWKTRCGVNTHAVSI